jgi:hypothetical protein
MKPLTRLMASGLSLQKAASQLGLVFSKKEERRIRSIINNHFGASDFQTFWM